LVNSPRTFRSKHDLVDDVNMQASYNDRGTPTRLATSRYV
jgi:hypothetical protein